MSAPTPGATWQQADLAVSFLARRGDFVPMLEVQEDVVRRLLARRGRPVGRFLDLGCGDGALTRLVLDLYPDAAAVMVDFSEPMLARAGEALRRMRATASLYRADLNDPSWADALPDGERYDAIVSGLAIHHLPAERKRELYAELFGLLAPGGAFVNMDYVLVEGPLEGLFDEQKMDALRADREAAAEGLEEVIIDEDDDDRPDLAQAQIEWLAQAGFEHAEVQFKWAEAAVMAAFKPAGEER